MSNISMVEAKLPPGFRFHPSDEELVCDYLMKKLAHSDNSSLMIDLDLNKCEPWDIPERACVGGKEWYFYTQRDRKYATGERRNRATSAGYWKATGKDRAILRKGTLVGMRKTLVFYHGRAPKGKKTPWVMHEFRLHPPMLPSPNTTSTKEDWVLCRAFYKNKEEIGKSSMGIRCYHEDTGSSSLPQPHLMDSYITFDSPPPHHTHQHEQVPCFSNNIFQTNPTNNTITTFNPISTMDHPLSAPKNNTIHDATTTYHLASSNSYSHSLALDPFSCDTKVLKAVLTQLTKKETNPVSQKESEGVISHNNHSETYLSQLPIPNLWNNY